MIVVSRSINMNIVQPLKKSLLKRELTFLFVYNTLLGMPFNILKGEKRIPIDFGVPK